MENVFNILKCIILYTCDLSGYVILGGLGSEVNSPSAPVLMNLGGRGGSKREKDRKCI